MGSQSEFALLCVGIVVVLACPFCLGLGWASLVVFNKYDKYDRGICSYNDNFAFFDEVTSLKGTTWYDVYVSTWVWRDQTDFMTKNLSLAHRIVVQYPPPDEWLSRKNQSDVENWVSQRRQMSHTCLVEQDLDHFWNSSLVLRGYDQNPVDYSGAIAGIVLGFLFLLVIVGVCIFYFGSVCLDCCGTCYENLKFKVGARTFGRTTTNGTTVVHN